MPADGRAAGSGRRAIFVYYRLAADRAAGLQEAVARLGPLPATWHLELMRRAEAAEPDAGLPNAATQTWMEVYRFDDDEARAAVVLQQLIEARARDAGLLDLIDGDRRYEVFESCA